MKAKNLRTHVEARRIRGGFTLIELLLVMMILAILAAVVVPKFTGRVEESKKKAAAAEISSIKTALELFESDNGRFPTQQEGLQALVTNPGSLPDWKHYYLERLPIDPWQRPYVYHCPGASGKDFDVYCTGPSGQDSNGSGDNIQ